jgi:hypothetical protein
MAKTTSPREKANTEARKGQRVVVTEDSVAVPTFYANNTAVETSLWDVFLKFAQTLETDKELNLVKVREVAYVRLSPQHARVVADILTAQLENYERVFGAIPRAPKATQITTE